MDSDFRDRKDSSTVLKRRLNPGVVRLLRRADRHFDGPGDSVMLATGTMHAANQPHADAIAPLEAIFDSVTEAVLLVDQDGTVRNCNRICSRYFGLPRRDLIGADISTFLPDAQNCEVAEFFAPFTSSPGDENVECVDGELRACRSDGQTFVAAVNASELIGDEGRIYVLTVRDVTDRKRAEAALRENEERYRALVEYAPEAIIVYDVDENRFIDANDNACRLFNLPRKRLLSVGPEAISPKMQPDGTSSFGVRRGFIESALSGEHPTFEWLHLDSDGNELPCEVRFSRLPSDEKNLMRVSISNIAERKRDEALSYAQNKVLEMIAASTPCDRTLRAICRVVEQVGDNFCAAISVVDMRGEFLLVEQAPSLPHPLRVALGSVRVAPDSLTSGSAVYHMQDRITPNIAEDAGWSRVLSAAKDAGIRSAWSFLIYGAAGRVLGTLDVFLDRCRVPSNDELEKLSRMARLAGIAIKRQNDEEKLRNSEAQYRGLFENVIDGVYRCSRDGDIIAANPAFVHMLGYDSVDDLKSIGRISALFVNPIDRERVFVQLDADGVVKNFEYRLRRKDGREIVVLDNSRAVRDSAGSIVANEGTLTDITERKRAETRVFEEKERAQVTLQSIGDGVITTDAKGNVDYINPVAQDLTGWDLRGARGRPISDVMEIVNEHTRIGLENPVVRCLKEGRVITLAENSILITRNGEEVPIQDSTAPIRDRIGNIIGSVIVFHDVGKESRLFRRLSFEASHDKLTGLLNRTEFENRLISAFETTRTRTDVTHALLYVDIDQFKVVNDTIGHTAGDALLQQLSEQIQMNVRSTDLLARLGGDEFGILLSNCSEQRAQAIAEDIRNVIEDYRFEWRGEITTVRCSIGVVIVSAENADVAGVMSSADVACYSAKDLGRNRVHLYKEGNASQRHEEMKWVARINNAIDEDRIELFYQPIIAIGSENGSRRAHYELLLRMRAEDGTLIGPGRFIPAAERYNLMPTLDRWVIRRALSELADRELAERARYTLSINLSGNSLSEDRFLEFVVGELEKQKLPPGAICFEITETAAISNLSRVVHFMQELKKLGCRFSLDDFGSGLSSFTYLKNLPVDFLKIDGQFIQNVAQDPVDESMVKAICEVGHAMGIETIAERVESQAVLDKLGTLGVEFAQGYYIARPAPADSFAPLGEWSMRA